MKKMIAALLAAVLAAGLAFSALAVSRDEGDLAAWKLYHMGLFQGIGDDPRGFPVFALEESPTRAQGVTMLVRLLGREAEALSGSWDTPFQDVPEWAVPYVGCAYHYGLTNGRSDTFFDAESPISVSEYLTLVLRALGYPSGGDYEWDSAWTFSDRLGVTDGRYNAATDTFDRGDVAWISQRALGTTVNGSDQTLRQLLSKRGITSDAEECAWVETCRTCQPDRMVFSLAPVSRSPQVYTRFTVESAYANGLPCQVEQFSTPEEVRKLALSEDQKNALASSFALIHLSYDEAAVLAAAAESVIAEGTSYPLIRFQLRCTGTLPDGKTVRELVVMEYYINGYWGEL